MSRKLGYIITIIIVLMGISIETSAQTPRVIKRRYIYHEGDTLMVAKVATIPIFRPGRRGDAALKRYKRLINAVKVTYPIAEEANQMFREIESKLDDIQKNRDRKSYIKEVESEAKERYTARLKRLSFYQGRILIKLIDRQTGITTYELVKELRGNFTAFFWQGLARIFNMNLKNEFDASDEDALLEGIIQLYEEGLI